MMVDYDRFFMKTFVNKHSILKNLTAIYWLKTNSFLSFFFFAFAQSFHVTYETTVFLFHVQAVVEAFSKTIYVISFFNFQICVINHIHFIIVITL